MRRPVALLAVGLWLGIGVAAAQPAPAQDAAQAPTSPPAATAPQQDAPPAPAAAPAAPDAGKDEAPPPPAARAAPPDIAFGAYQRGLFITAFREATRRVEVDPNDAAAMTLLAELYARGVGVKQDWPSAAKWYRLAVQRGDKRAAYDLAMLLLQGTGVDKNPEEARTLLESAAETVPDAAYALGLLLLNENKPDSDRRAVTLFRSAVGGMSGDAEYALAVLYRQGRGVPRDANQAAVWMSRAAAAHSAAAELEYGILLFNGDGVERDEARAAKFFARAAEQGNAVAQNRLARLYAAGRGVAKNPVEAVKWHLLARSAGVKDEWLDQVTRDLSPQDRDRAEAAARAWRDR